MGHKKIDAAKADVLLVDDEPSITEFLRRILTGHDVREAHGVREALSAIDRRVPDVVVTDLGMDDGGGKHLLAALADSHPRVVRIIYSAAPAWELVNIVESGLAHAAIEKRGDASALRSELEQLIASEVLPPAPASAGAEPMNCFGCKSAATVERLGNHWCGQCVAALKFEERLAAANGMFIADVFLKDGRVGYVFGQDQEKDAPADLRQIGITHGDVLLELVAAARALRRRIRVVNDRVVSWATDAPQRAREFIDVATKHEALLADDERRDIASVLAVARSIARSVH